MATTASTRPPLWRNVRVLRIAAQIAFLVVLAIVLRETYLNLEYGIDQRNISLSFDFLRSRAGFGIKEHLIAYGPNRAFIRAFMVGVTNTMLVAGLGIVFATVLGLVIGVARLSPNWLVRKIAQVYVEVVRNTPPLIMIIFLYSAVILQIPRIQDSLSLGGLAFLSNRGAAVPWVEGGGDFAEWWLAVAAGLAAAVAVWRWRTAVNERTGRPHYRIVLSAATVVGAGTIAYLVLPDPFAIQLPELGQRNYEGGIQMSPELAGVLLGLVAYTASFIGEIVRGSILAVSKGQKEAAEALGLRPGQQLRYVVLPQAMRIAIPPINSQYLNLTKNTSLAFAIGFPEIVNVSTTIINQAGREVQVNAMVLATYLILSLAISLVMNVINRRVTLKGESR